MSTEEERISKLLNSELETSLFKDNCDHGVHVEGALIAEINKRTAPSKRQWQKQTNSDSLVQLLSENDPFAAAVSFPAENFVASSTSIVDRSSKVSERQQRSNEAKHLAAILAKQDPFAIVDAMKTVVHNQFSSSSNIVRGEQPSCDEKCQGCSYCDGMDYINHIRIEQNLDAYEQAVEEEDGGLFFENDDGLAVETDDDCVEYKDHDEKEGPPAPSSSSSSANPHPFQSSGNTMEVVWNPNNASFWEVRQEGKALLVDALQQKRNLNSSCTSCFSALYCHNCEANTKNPSAKKSASYIKEFAMRTTLMELGVSI